jgi:MraZ protein
MLRGSYITQIDDKGRIKIPAAFRHTLVEKYGSQEFYMTSLDGECVWLYPIDEWVKKEEKLLELPSMEMTVKKFLDRTSYYGQMASMDIQGRMLVPSGLRESASLQSEVIVFGYLTYLEIWCHEKFQARMKAEPFTPDDQRELAKLGI